MSAAQLKQPAYWQTRGGAPDFRALVSAAQLKRGNHADAPLLPEAISALW